MLINFDLAHGFPILCSIEIERTKHCVRFLIFGNNGRTNRLFKLMTNSLICKLYSLAKMIKTFCIIPPLGNLLQLMINNLHTVLIVLLLLQTNRHLILNLLSMTCTINDSLFFFFLLPP